MGDPLDERLVEVGLKLLESEGVDALTLRRIAREAGVSHGAPLRHFASLSDLRAEIAAHGFGMLSEALDEASQALPAGTGARARLRAAGTAYVEAAVAHPSLFALMSRPEALDPTNEAFQREAPAAFERLLGLVRAAQDEGYERDTDSRLLAGAVWASVHGLASLWSQGAFIGPVPGVRLEDALTVSLRLAVGDEQGESA